VRAYRRLAHSDTWHFCVNCSHWRRRLQDHKVGDTAVEKRTKPTTGELCNECQAKERRHGCDDGSGR
jgi:hypothetical protein